MKRIPGEKWTEQNNRKISHFWKEKKSGERGKKYFKQEGGTGSTSGNKQELIRGRNWALKKGDDTGLM